MTSSYMARPGSTKFWKRPTTRPRRKVTAPIYSQKRGICFVLPFFISLLYVYLLVPFNFSLNFFLTFPLIFLLNFQRFTSMLPTSERLFTRGAGRQMFFVNLSTRLYLCALKPCRFGWNFVLHRVQCDVHYAKCLSKQRGVP